MKTFITVISFSVFSLFFQESAFAQRMNCFSNVDLAYVNVGYTDGSIASSDEGNAIYIGFYDNDNRLLEAKVDVAGNLNDGSRGTSIYKLLTTALAQGRKVSAWNNNLTYGGSGTCSDFDEIRLSE